MIIFNILLQEEADAGIISEFLITERYALQTHIDTNTTSDQQGRHHKTIRLFFITKALLYNTIDEEIHKRFFTAGLVMYATPVSHVNAEFYELVRSRIRAA